MTYKNIDKRLHFVNNTTTNKARYRLKQNAWDFSGQGYKDFYIIDIFIACHLLGDQTLEEDIQSYDSMIGDVILIFYMDYHRLLMSP